MKHLDITRPKSNGLAEIMVTITGNSFGDQILELKKFKGNNYETIYNDSNPEGSHLTNKEIKLWAFDWAQRKGEF